MLVDMIFSLFEINARMCELLRWNCTSPMIAHEDLGIKKRIGDIVGLLIGFSG